MARHIFTPEDTRKSHEVRVYHPLSEETKRKISESHLGVRLSEATRQKQSEARLRYYQAHPEMRFEHTKQFKGQTRTLETRIKTGIGRKRYLQEHPEAKEVFAKLHVGKPKTEEHKKKLALSHIGLKASQEAKEKMSLARRGVPKTPEYKRKMRLKWQDPKFVNKMMKLWNTKPNKAELELLALLQEKFPNQFEYNGDFRLGISLSGYIPDFVNINGKKQVIELFGEYWHNRKGRGAKERTGKYKAIGWSCLIIWYSELKNTNALVEKIKAFVGGG